MKGEGVRRHRSHWTTEDCGGISPDRNAKGNALSVDLSSRLAWKVTGVEEKKEKEKKKKEKKKKEKKEKKEQISI